MSEARIFHAGDLGRIAVIGKSYIPCRIESVGEWMGSNPMVEVTITAQRSAGGYTYPAGHRLTLHGSNVWPRQPLDPGDWHVWCDGAGHRSPCSECGDVHAVRVLIPGRVHGGVYLAGATLVRCRRCNRLAEYVPEVATR